MTPKRAAAWTLVGALAAAWFASAAGVIGQPWRTARAGAPAVVPPTPEPVSFDVDAQAKRLQRRLAAAPTPTPVRNPFAFAPRQPVHPRTAVAAAVLEPAAAPIEIEPPLTLIGVAEDGAGDNMVRTAMIAGIGEELFLVRVGQPVGGRYKVLAISGDAVELKDEATDRVRRLALR